MSTRGEARRRQILEAAEEVFGRDGYWGARTEEVARRVGVTQPALYRHFASKRELFLAAVSLRQEEMNAAIGAAIASGDSALDKLRRVSSAAIDMAHRYPHMARLRLQVSAVAATDDELRPLVCGTVDLMLHVHTTLLGEAMANGEIRGDIDPSKAAASFTAQAFLMYLGLSLEHEGAAPDRSRAVFEQQLALLSAQAEADPSASPESSPRES